MGIGVLLGGESGDRYAVLHAIALSKRLREPVHAIQQRAAHASSRHSPPPTEAGQSLLLQLANVLGMTVRCHVLEGQADLIALLREQRISCLIVGVSDEMAAARAEKKMQTVRRAVAHDQQWSIGSFWALVTGPWTEEAMAAALVDLPEGCRDIVEKGGT